PLWKYVLYCFSFFEAPCQVLNCTQDEICGTVNGVYGCVCGTNNSRPNPNIYDAIETCSASTGTLSLSRCQLFEAGYSEDVLHLNNRSCKGKVKNDRLVFDFDTNSNMCGSTLEKNSTHITFRNNVGTTDGMGVISHVSGLNIAISCVYPLMQRISLSLGIEESVISKELSSVGFYQISMIPYIDSHFLHPYSGNVTLEVNQLMYIFMEVNQFNNNQTINNSQIALVLDNCWATPINQIDSNIRWNLIIKSCPNPADGTVAVLQNGVSTSSRFSFRMFTFTGLSNIIYLHCQVHLCLRDSGNCT
ncbi:hypothetical protein C0J50_22648, partial [Silurus asotus]